MCSSEGEEKLGEVDTGVPTENELARAQADAEAKARAEAEEKERQYTLRAEREEQLLDKRAAKDGIRLAISRYRDGQVEEAFRCVINLPTDQVYGLSRLLYLASPECLSAHTARIW